MFFFDTLTGTYNLGGTDIVFPTDFGATKDMGVDHSYRYIKIPENPMHVECGEFAWSSSAASVIDVSFYVKYFIVSVTTTTASSRVNIIYDEYHYGTEKYVCGMSSAGLYVYNISTDATRIKSVTHNSDGTTTITINRNASRAGNYYWIAIGDDLTW